MVHDLQAGPRQRQTDVLRAAQRRWLEPIRRLRRIRRIRRGCLGLRRRWLCLDQEAGRECSPCRGAVHADCQPGGMRGDRQHRPRRCPGVVRRAAHPAQLRHGHRRPQGRPGNGDRRVGRLDSGGGPGVRPGRGGQRRLEQGQDVRGACRGRDRRDRQAD